MADAAVITTSRPGPGQMLGLDGMADRQLLACIACHLENLEKNGRLELIVTAVGLGVLILLELRR